MLSSEFVCPTMSLVFKCFCGRIDTYTQFVFTGRRVVPRKHYHFDWRPRVWSVRPHKFETFTFITPIYGLFENFTDLTCLSCLNLLESQRHGLVNSIQVPHTYSVSQPLPSYVYLWRSRHPKTTRTYEYMEDLDHFYALNLSQSTGITEVCRHQVHAGTPHIFCLTITSLTCIYPYIIWVRTGPKKLHDSWNVTWKHEISRAWRRVNVWLSVMPQTRRIWLARLLTSCTSPPRMSRNGHHKVTCEIGVRKSHVKARNLKRTVSCEWVVGVNVPNTTYLTTAASNIIHVTPKNVEMYTCFEYRFR